MQYLSLKQIRQIKDKALIKSQYDYLIIRLFAETGMRISEVLNVQPSDLLELENTYQLVVRGKGNVIRQVDISSSLYSFLQMYIKQKKLRYTDKLITHKTRAIQYRVKKLAGIHCHAFRHSYAIHLLRQTKNIRYVQSQLGHTSLTTTQIYLRYMDFQQEQALLEELF